MEHGGQIFTLHHAGNERPQIQYVLLVVQYFKLYATVLLLLFFN